MKYKEYYQHYLSLHQNRVCKLLHFIGQCCTLIATFIIVSYQFWYAIVIIPFIVYPFAWVGHFFFEKNKPAAFNNPWMAKVSDWNMFFDIIRGKIKL